MSHDVATGRPPDGPPFSSSPSRRRAAAPQEGRVSTAIPILPIILLILTDTSTNTASSTGTGRGGARTVQVAGLDRVVADQADLLDAERALDAEPCGAPRAQNTKVGNCA